MIKKLIAPMLLAAGLLLFSATDAQAQSACRGSPQKVTSAGFSDPSTCSCFGGALLEGGAYVSGNGAAWIWFRGAGRVAVALEFTRTVTRGGVTSVETKQLYSNLVASSGLGAEGALTFDGAEIDGWNWTGRFRADCIRPS